MDEPHTIPQLARILFSVHASILSGISVSFGQLCLIRNKKKKLIGTGSPNHKLFMLNYEVLRATSANVVTDTEVASNQNKIDLWHQRLTHVNIKQLRPLTKAANRIDITLNGAQTFCLNTRRDASTTSPSMNTIKCTQKLQLVDTDVCGPMQTQSFRGSRYFMTYFMKHKSESPDKFKCSKLQLKTNQPPKSRH